VRPTVVTACISECRAWSRLVPPLSNSTLVRSCGESYSAGRIRLLFLIRDLDVGGAQRQLVELAKRLDPKVFNCAVATFYRGGAFEGDLAECAHIRMFPLAKRGRWDVLGLVWRLLTVVREFRPSLIYSFQPVANELALLAGRVFHARVVWGLRTANADYALYHWTLAIIVRLGARLSGLADAIVVNSEAGRDFHIGVGYRGARMTVIENGIDTNRFMPNRAAGLAVRARWGIRQDTCLAGLVARIDPHKDHATFLDAVAQLSDLSHLHFVCVGDGPPGARARLEALVESRGLSNRVLVVGEEHDMPSVYNAFDLLVTSSRSEGFSNVIAEAMSTGVRCVVTEAGDSARIVGDTGLVVPRQDPDALALAIRAAYGRRGELWSAAARARIVSRFSQKRMVAETTRLLVRLVDHRARDG